MHPAPRELVYIFDNKSTQRFKVKFVKLIFLEQHSPVHIIAINV